MVEMNEVKRIFVTSNDQLTRFGFNYLEAMFKAHNVEIVVMEDKDKEKYLHEEFINDVTAIIASFSGDLSNIRSNKNNA